MWWIIQEMIKLLTFHGFILYSVWSLAYLAHRRCNRKQWQADVLSVIVVYESWGGISHSFLFFLEETFSSAAKKQAGEPRPLGLHVTPAEEGECLWQLIEGDDNWH